MLRGDRNKRSHRNAKLTDCNAKLEHHNVKLAHRNEERPLLPSAEKDCAQQQRPSAAKNNKVFKKGNKS